ncbi:Uncharacterised protein [Shigella sonnei]|nr:Uncharacterised protein [Shigella sonnei]
MPTPPRPGGVAWATIVSLSLMMFLLLCVADARCLSTLRKEKRRSTDRPYFSENSPNQDFFFSRLCRPRFSRPR